MKKNSVVEFTSHFLNQNNLISIFDEMDNGFQIIDKDFRYVYLNKIAEDFSKYPPGSLIGKTIMEMYPGIEKTDIFQSIKRVMESGQKETLYTEFCYPDSSTDTFFLNFQPYLDGISIYTLNLTKRLKEQNIELSENLDLLHDMANQVPGAIYQYRKHPDGRHYFPFASKNMIEIAGVTAEEVKNDAAAAFANVHPDDMEMIQESTNHSFQTLEIWKCDYRAIIKGKGERLIRGIAKPEKLLDDSVLWHGYIVDITEEKILENKLRVRNSELEQFNYVVSHDLQEPLNSIASMAKLLKRDYEALSEVGKKSLDAISKSTSRLRSSIYSLLELSRVGKNSNKQQIVFKEMIDDLNTDLSYLIKKRGANLYFDQSIEGFYAYKLDFYKLLQNIIVNGIKYTPAGRNPEISVNVIEQPYYYLFSVTDNGIGIKEQYYQRIFEPFQRLHNNNTSYSGSGIGLAHCKKVVELHNGKIWVVSELDKGSTFYFTIEK